MQSKFDPVPCQCGDKGSFFIKHKWRCVECAAELRHGEIPPAEKITGHTPRYPDARLGKVPGTGEGNDYFGNHT